MDKKKIVSVKIGNMTYNLSAEENAQYISDIAHEADELMREIKRENPALSTINVAVLALINALDQRVKLEQGNARSAKSKKHELSYADLNNELMKLREVCWDLKKELLYQKNLAEVYEERIAELSKLSMQDKSARSVYKNEQKPLDELQTSFQDFNELDEH